MRAILYCFLFVICSGFAARAQQDTSTTETTAQDSVSLYRRPKHLSFLDSVALAGEFRQKAIADSLANIYVNPDTNRVNQYTAYILTHLYKGHTFLDIPFNSGRNMGYGHFRKVRDPGIILLIIGILLYTALLNYILGNDMNNVFRALYNRRTAQVDKDDRHINAWAFIFLFSLFGLTFGLFLYQLASYKNMYYSVSGFQLFIALTVIIICLFALKFVLLKFLGFLFDINKMVSEYITALYLTYINIAFVFLPVTVCFSLLAAQYIPYLLAVAVLLIVAIFVWIYLRSSVSIISNFRFHKFYLFLYLCALEICPILILIKVLNL